MRTSIKFLFPLLLTASGFALAEADGPDYYRVQGVAANDVLNIRSKADPHAENWGRPRERTALETSAAKVDSAWMNL